MENLKKTAGIIDIIIKVLLWIVGVAMAIVIVALLYLLISGNDFSGMSGINAMLKFNGLMVPSGSIPKGEFAKATVYFALTAIITVGLSFYIMIVVRKILGTMKAGRPFDPSASKNFRVLGWATIAFGVLSNIFSLLSRRSALAVIEKALRGSGVEVSGEFALDIRFITVAAFLFLFFFCI